MGLVAPQLVEYSQARDWAHVPSIGRQILIHCTTREVLCIHYSRPNFQMRLSQIKDFVGSRYWVQTRNAKSLVEKEKGRSGIGQHCRSNCWPLSRSSKQRVPSEEPQVGWKWPIWSTRALLSHHWELPWEGCACLLSCFSCVWLFATLWIVAHQAPLSMGFSRQEYWSELPSPPPGDFPELGIEPTSLAL